MGLVRRRFASPLSPFAGVATALVLLLVGPAAALEPPPLRASEVSQPTWIEWLEVAGLRSEDPAAALPRMREIWEGLDAQRHFAGKVHAGLRLGTDLVAHYRTDEALSVFNDTADLARSKWLNDEVAYAELELGKLAEQDGRDADAIEHLRTASTRTVDNGEIRAVAFAVLGRLLLAAGESREAGESLRQAQTIAQEVGSTEAQIIYLLTLASLNEQRGDFETVANCFATALRVLDSLPVSRIQSTGARRLRSTVYLDQARFQWRQFDRDVSRGSLRNAFVFAQAAGDVRLSATIWFDLARLAFDVAAYGLAGQALDQAKTTMDDAGYRDRPLLARLRAWHGRIALRVGDIESAARLLDEATGLLGENGPIRLRAAFALYRGEVARARGAYQQAIDARRQSAELAGGISDRRGQIIALSELGATWSLLGNSQAATTVLTEAVRLARQAGSKRELARVLAELGNAAQTLEPLRESVTISRALRDLREAARTQLIIAELLLERGELDGATEFARDALTMTGERLIDLGFRAKRVTGRIHLATAEDVEGRERDASVQQAINWLAAALRDAEKIQDKSLLGAIYADLGRAARLKGDTANALGYFTNAAQLLEQARETLVGNEGRTSLLAQNEAIYAAIVDIQVDRGNLDAAFRWGEMAKARTFLEQLAESQRNIRAGVDPALLAEEHSLTRQLAANQRVRVGLLDRGEAAEQQLAQLDREIARLQQAFARVKEQMREQSPAYAQLRFPQPVSLEHVQRTLGEGQLLVSYRLGRQRSHAFGITRDALTHAVLPGTDDLAWRVGYQRDLVIAGTPICLDQLAANSAELGQLLLGPFATALESHSELIVAPDGVLHYLPFETLSLTAPEAVDSYADIPYLITVVDSVRYVQSATVLTTLADRRAREGNAFLLALGDPRFAGEGDAGRTVAGGDSAVPATFARLPNTSREVDAIAALADGRQGVTVLLRDAAREAALKQQAGSARYLHVATHGVLDETHPSFSGLVLAAPDAPTGDDDGYLYLVEIFNLELTARLVVLSACQTGLGRLVSGEGVEGLSRAFMYAGSPRLVVSLWSVDDASTATLMTAFYERLWSPGAEDQTAVAGALAEAKRELIRSGRYSAPYFWSPFIAIGAR